MARIIFKELMGDVTFFFSLLVNVFKMDSLMFAAVNGVNIVCVREFDSQH